MADDLRSALARLRAAVDRAVADAGTDRLLQACEEDESPSSSSHGLRDGATAAFRRRLAVLQREQSGGASKQLLPSAMLFYDHIYASPREPPPRERPPPSPSNARANKQARVHRSPPTDAPAAAGSPIKEARPDATGGRDDVAAAAAASPSTPPKAAANAAVPEAHHAAALPEETLRALAAVRKPLCDGRLSEEARMAECASGLAVLLSHTELASMRAACAALGAATLPDEAVMCACQAAAQPNVGGRAAAAFAAAVLRPRLAALEQPASRTLFGALAAFTQAQSRPLVDQLVVPLMRMGGSGSGSGSGGGATTTDQRAAAAASSSSLNAPQIEALSRLLKELPEALLGHALSGFLATTSDEHDDDEVGGGTPFPPAWTEAHASLLQTVLARKPNLEGGCLSELLVQADANADRLRKSLKFSSLLSTLVKTHGGGPQMRPHLSALRRVVERLETFMRKSILAAVDKLEA